nr:MAG TPA: 43 kDa tail protein [Caudoviricetes sp.]
MNVELLITEKRTGKIWNAANAAKSITYTTNRTGSPGTLKFTVQKSGTLSFVEGDIVVLNIDGQLIFLGWVFTKSKDRWGAIDVTCYDRMRYLKANASYSFYGQTAGDIIKQIAEDYQLSIGQIEDTGYAIPSLIESDQSCLDIIQSAVEQTLLNTGNLYIFYDSGAGLCLTAAENMKSNIMIGDKSLVLDYTYKTDIDTQTYNSVKVAMPNETTGGADVYIVQDSDNIARWGLLQLYQKVDNDSNSAQIQAQAQATLSYYNRRLRTLKVSSLGVLGLRAGQMILMQIKGLGDIDLNQWLLIEKITHTFENDKHTMDIELYEI